MEPPRVILKHRRARPFFARHPWIYAGSIARVDVASTNRALGEDLEPGCEVAVFSDEGTFIARGLYNPHSLIRVRLYRWDDEPLDDDFWRDRIESAFRLRRDVLKLDAPGRACRLIASESDGLSGLTVDRYDRWLVAQFSSLALYRLKASIITLIAERSSAEGISVRQDRGVAELEGFDRVPDGVVTESGTWPEEPVEIVEHEIRYRVDLEHGQKTGFFLDQRENRRAAATYAEGKRVLDLFCYTGGFSLNALKHGGASYTLGFDASTRAIELARENAVANRLSRARFEVSEIATALARLRESSERFGLIVCDPPKFARGAGDLEAAMRGYLKLNQAALDLLQPGGVLVTCSCSGNVDRRLFAEMLGHLAEKTSRSIQILEQRGQAADHPISASCLETDYLKCFICRVG